MTYDNETKQYSYTEKWENLDENRKAYIQSVIDSGKEQSDIDNEWLENHAVNGVVYSSLATMSMVLVVDDALGNNTYTVNEILDEAELLFDKYTYGRKNGESISFHNIPLKWKNENGEEITLTDEQKIEFEEILSTVNDTFKDIQLDNNYQTLTYEGKAKVLNKINDIVNFQLM